MNDKVRALQRRAHTFFVGVLELCERLPTNTATRQIAPQLIDSAGSTASNYRAACRARSTAEFIAKIGVAAEEADESKGWPQPRHSRSSTRPTNSPIFVKSRKTAEARLNAQKTPRHR